MRKLKADLHTHTVDDPRDFLAYSAETLIDSAAACGVEVLSITLHERCLRPVYLQAYARDRGILLIPGMEQLLDGKHVLLLNPDEAQAQTRTFADLRALGKRESVLIAPHPFYRTPECLGAMLEAHIDLFDGIEYCSLYLPGLNLNRKAQAIAQRYGLPLIGTSDTHTMPYSSNTFAWIEAEKEMEPVLDAIRAGHVELATRPHTRATTARIVRQALLGAVRNKMVNA